jgi:hypothetical protein
MVYCCFEMCPFYVKLHSFYDSSELFMGSSRLLLCDGYNPCTISSAIRNPFLLVFYLQNTVFHLRGSKYECSRIRPYICKISPVDIICRNDWEV